MEDVPVLACMEDVPVQACMETCMEDVLLQACMEDVPAQAMELESQACMEYVPVQAMELESQACMEYAMELESQACMEYVPVQAMELESQACMEVGPTQACMETCMEDVGLQACMEAGPTQACMEAGPTQACMEVVPVKAMGEQKNMHPQQFYELSKKIVSVQSQIMDQSDEVSLDVNELANSLREQLKINKAFSRECCIYRVPERLRKLHRKAYTPRVVSIGPIHHGKENLKAMEDHKIMYLQQFLEQNKVSVEDLMNIIKENETKLRDCYAETIDLSRKDFATMILLDAVFIIMFLLNRKYWSELYDRGRTLTETEVPERDL
uniref:Uncharacterized protein n=1 Tax=Populus davidiana TaxID=266767 RepID=A0A6M2EIS4_9ROSI